MKEKISLILVLGIVGVLVVSFIVNSRASAVPVLFEEIDIWVDTGYGEVPIGYIEVPIISVVMDTISEEWYLDSTIDWESVETISIVMDEVQTLADEIAEAQEVQELLNALRGTEITYYSGYSADDLPIEGYPVLKSFSTIHELSWPTHEVGENIYWVWTGSYEPILIVEYTVNGVATGCKVIKCRVGDLAYCEPDWY